MTVLLSVTTRPMAVRAPRVSFGWLAACRDIVQRYFAQREAIARLGEFDDGELRDIGLTRSQIEPAVRGLEGAGGPRSRSLRG